jgi:hypothetical protein
MSENDSEYGYVTENSNVPTTGHLVLYSVTGGRVTYRSFAERAQELGLPRTFLPSIRKLNNAFAIAKDQIDGLRLPALQVAEGWDGVVNRKVKVMSLKKSHEYVVQIECRGRARGKMHIELINMFRLEFSPPTDFNVAKWSQDYMNNIWPEETMPETEDETEDETEGKTEDETEYETSDEDFIAAWQSNDSIEAVARALSMEPAHVEQRSQTMRDHGVPVKVYVDNEDDVIEFDENSIQECISVTPYWDDSEMDAALYARVTATLMAEFVTVAICIDAKMLRDKIVKVLQNELGGLPFRSGQGAWFIPKYNDDDSYLETLENYSRLLESFGNANSLSRTPGEANWLGEDGKPRDWHRSSTNLRIMGYIDNERQMSYLRRDIETNIGREIGEYQHKLMEVANDFNEEKINEFEKRLDTISGLRTDLVSRLANLTNMVGGELNLDTNMFSDIQENLNTSTSRVRAVRSAAADRILNLSRFN